MSRWCSLHKFTSRLKQKQVLSSSWPSALPNKDSEGGKQAFVVRFSFIEDTPMNLKTNIPSQSQLAKNLPVLDSRSPNSYSWQVPGIPCVGEWCLSHWEIVVVLLWTTVAILQIWASHGRNVTCIFNLCNQLGGLSLAPGDWVAEVQR